MEKTFYIITPTFGRPKIILRAVSSLKRQKYSNWKQVIIIDDEVSDYSELVTQTSADSRFVTIQNEKNIGKNKSLNRALDYIRKQNLSGYILFLDDDDWLDPDCLLQYANIIDEHPQHNWFVTNRVNQTSGESYTKNLTERDKINYLKDYLIGHKFSGDATHCIATKIALKATFPNSIKNAEEWLYFAKLAKFSKNFLYQNITSTISEGYTENGLTDQYQRRSEMKKNVMPILKEIWKRKLLHPYILLYTLSRIVRRFL